MVIGQIERRWITNVQFNLPVISWVFTVGSLGKQTMKLVSPILNFWKWKLLWRIIYIYEYVMRHMSLWSFLSSKILTHFSSSQKWCIIAWEGSSVTCQRLMVYPGPTCFLNIKGLAAICRWSWVLLWLCLLSFHHNAGRPPISKLFLSMAYNTNEINK